MIKLLLVDDQRILRESLKLIIENDKDIIVIGCAGDGKEALQLCSEKSPDVVLMDIMMSGINGIEGTRLIKEKFKDIKIIVLTTFNDDENISKALKNGADGYILKDIEPDELISTIKNTFHGLRVVHHEVFNSILKKYDQLKVNCDYEKKNLNFNLSETESKILSLIAYGKSNKEIGECIFLSEGRVKNIITGMLKKLNLKDRTLLAVFAVKNNFI